MDRNDIIKKTLIKLGMIIGEPQDPVPEHSKEKLLKILWNEDEPRNVIKIIQGFFLSKRYSKEAKQDLFYFFKKKGLFKRSLRHRNMEKAWRILLKEQKLQGFMLEN